MDSQKFGTFISELRKERGWTQLELAQKLNVTDGDTFMVGISLWRYQPYQYDTL